MPYKPTYQQAPHPAYDRPSRKTNTEPVPEPSIKDTAADEGGVEIERFYDYQVQPQPVYLIDEKPGPYVVHTTYSSYTVTPDIGKIVGNQYSEDRTVTVMNSGSVDVYISASNNDKLMATRYRLKTSSGGPGDYVKVNSTEPIFVYCDSGNEGEVSVMEEWRDST